MDDIDKLFAELEKDVYSIMSGSGNKKAKEVYKKHAEESYDTYIPRYDSSRYRHGEDGSFADDVNFVEEVSKVGATIIYEMENHRETDCVCPDCRAKRHRIDGYIEDGIAGKYRIQPKEVYEKAQEELDDVMPDFIHSELNKKGW